ncbi:MAG: hypothetical protein JO017_02505 [Actinobacteria bacterium]|nr:hypothetical protein [Actinomycetota bacterium]
MYSAALLGVALASSAVTVAVRPTRTVTVSTVPAAPVGAHLFRVQLAQPATPRRRPAVHRHVRHAVRTAAPKPVPESQAAPAPRTTPSLYERTTSPVVLHAQGCRAGKASTNGIVILDFGKPDFGYGSYGTITFADRFVTNAQITQGMEAYAQGYVTCLPRDAQAKIVLVRGTSNYALHTVPSGVTAGRLWAEETGKFGTWLRQQGLDAHVAAAAGDDAEPAWDRTFTRTYNFFRGFGSAANGYLLYNYGSLDGGPGQIWSVEQAFYVTTGMRYARAVPEIYTQTMAKQWALLSRLAAERYGKPVNFVGVMTQHSKECQAGCYTPAEAHTALVHELAKSPKTRVRMLASATNIGTPAPVRRRPSTARGPSAPRRGARAVRA